MTTIPVLLDPVPPADRPRPPVELPRTVDDALAALPAWPADLVPGAGRTRRLWELLATLAAGDLAVARAVEPHLDARAILAQAGARPTLVPADATWGVYAAEAPGTRLDAVRDGERWVLRGVKPWCSLAGRLDAALVTAHLPDGERGLFAVGLRTDGGRPGTVTVLDEAWAARGLVEIPSTGVRFDDAPAEPVGEPGWYLRRPGFWWGGIGVAACWYGGAVGLARRLLDGVRGRDAPLLHMHLGAVDEGLQTARRALAEAARLVDDGTPDDDTGRLVAKRVRGTVARVCEDVLTRTAHALGPAPLALDTAHAKRVADLQVYVRQHHAERDEASLGASLATADGVPW